MAADRPDAGLEGLPAGLTAVAQWLSGLLLPCFLLSLQSAAHAQDDDIEARVGRPYPLIMPLDYPLARSGAWINALLLASGSLAAVQPKLVAGLSEDQRLALAAQVYAIHAYAPESAPGHSVWLELRPRPAMRLGNAVAAADLFRAARRSARRRPPPWQRDAILNAQRQTELLAAREELIRDTRHCVASLSALWPDAQPDPAYAGTTLAPLSQRLDALFELERLLPPALEEWLSGPAEPDRLARLASAAPENPVAWLMLAEAQMQKNQEQAAALSAGKALRLADARENAHLAARAAFVRGLANMRLQRLSLAENDLGVAIRRLAGHEGSAGSAAPYLAARGALRMHMGKNAEMCDDLERACGLGDCSALVAMRRKSLCLEP